MNIKHFPRKIKRRVYMINKKKGYTTSIYMRYTEQYWYFMILYER